MPGESITIMGDPTEDLLRMAVTGDDQHHEAIHPHIHSQRHDSHGPELGSRLPRLPWA